MLGDLHGTAAALEEVLRKINFNKNLDKLIFIGDLADGVPNMINCLKILLSIKNFVGIVGNHDHMLKKWLESAEIGSRWIKQGGLNTLNEINDKGIRALDLLEEYFDKCKYYHIENESQFFCHGGFNHKRIITKQRKINFCINRKLYKLSKQYEKNNLKIKPIFDEANSLNIKEIFIGHTPTKYGKPEFNSNLINVDTGAGAGGKLTIMDIKTKKYVQSRSTTQFYENYKF